MPKNETYGVFSMTCEIKKVRVRFAPSPTGHLHVGGLRTALFNFLYARHLGGQFLIRVEDTDVERSKPEYVQSQLLSLAWCGIESDEPLLFQSERFSVYAAVAQTLLAEKKVYRCRCLQEDVDERLKKAGITDLFHGYDEYCRMKNYDDSQPFVLRFAVPDTMQPLVVKDLILGTLEFKKEQLDDFIIVRSDGSPTYNFAVVIDDMFMRISHIIRAQEHIPNTPKQILLYQACNAESIPFFAHIPFICGSDGQKLSKRDGAVDVLWYKQAGYRADALVNYMVRLGWSHGDQEVFTRQELVDFFSLDAVGKKPAIFDVKKLEWMNGVYCKQLSAKACYEWIVADVMPDLSRVCHAWSVEQLITAVGLFKERVSIGQEMTQAIIQLYQGPLTYLQEDLAQWMSLEVRSYFEQLIKQFKDVQTFDIHTVSTIVKELCATHALKLVTLAQPLRIALTGRTTSPGVFEMLTLLGKDESIRRMQLACVACKQNESL